MKNIFDPGVKEELINRITKLSPDATAKWGKMNVNQGMRHMAMAFDIPVGKLDPTVAAPVNMPKWLLRFFLLNMKPPKERAETFVEMNLIKNNVSPTDFAAEQKKLLDNLIAFYDAKMLLPENKLVGKFSKTDWGKLNYNHTDHHLRQFGG